MFQLATLSSDPPDFRSPFLPPWDLNGSPPRGPTCGLDLKAYPFSDTLTDIIFECLYETPGFRPELQDLKLRVMRGYQAAFRASPRPEPYEDFLQPEPFVSAPPVAPPAAPNPPPAGQAEAAGSTSAATGS